MKDKNGKKLRVDDKVEITFYSYYECLCSCIGRVNVDGKIEILTGIEPKDYYCREITKIEQDFYLDFEKGEYMRVLDDNEVTVRTADFLIRKGIENFEDLANISSEEIMRQSDLGRRTLEEILKLMKKYDISFSDK